MDSFVQFAMAAAKEAMADAAFDPEALDTERCGVIVSSGTYLCNRCGKLIYCCWNKGNIDHICSIDGRYPMLRDSFSRVYTKFKLHFYQKVFEKIQERETSLTTVETFCMEIIYAANEPTVNEFAKIANLSSPNAAYKVNNLVKKGYLERVQSKEDKREFHLRVTQKYLDYYNISYQYLNTVLTRLENRFTSEELEVVNRVLRVMDEELMPEIPI